MIEPLDSCVSRFRQAVSQVDKSASERPNRPDEEPYDPTGRHTHRKNLIGFFPPGKLVGFAETSPQQRIGKSRYGFRSGRNPDLEFGFPERFWPYSPSSSRILR